MDEELYDEELTIDDAIEAFMSSTPDDENLSDDDNEEPTTDADDEEAEAEEVDEEADEEEAEEDEDPDDADDDTDEDEGSDDEGEDAEGDLASDDAEVEIAVGDKTERVSVKDLKRLYGQEASLTQKSQAIATQRRIVEAQGLFAAQVLQDRYAAAKANADKYKDVDLYRASRELEVDEFDSLRSAKENAESEVAALEREGSEFIQKSQQMRQNMLREQAREAVKEIVKVIPNWNDELYGTIRTYAVEQGMDTQLVNEIVDPAAILMMHKAMQYDNVQSAKSKVTKKVSKAPKKAMGKGDSATDTTTSKMKAKQRTAMESGDVDDVAEAFLAAMKE